MKKEFRETYHEGLQEYFDGDWITAKEIFEEAQVGHYDFLILFCILNEKNNIFLEINS